MLVYQAAAFESSSNACPSYTRGECTTCVQPPPPFSKKIGEGAAEHGVGTPRLEKERCVTTQKQLRGRLTKYPLMRVKWVPYGRRDDYVRHKMRILIYT